MQIVLKRHLYERRKVTMTNKNATHNGSEKEESLIKNNKVKEFINANAVALGIALVQIIVFFISMKYQIENTNIKLDSHTELVKKDIEAINNDIEGVVNSIEINSDNVKACNTRIDNYIFNNKSDEGIKVTFKEEIGTGFFGSDYQVYDLTFIKAPSWASTDFIAVDDNGNQYRAEELVDEKILVSYTNDDQETCFYGQYNELNQWDGNCIINVYKDDILELIMDATYKDGILINYEQILVDHVKNRWVVSKRFSNGDVNIGETWTYIKEKDYKKLFDMDIVVSDDVMSVKYFMEHLTTPLEGYYNGQTTDGLYNDTTGKAYLIKYFENGLSKTIYQGNFVNGQFNDKTGSAWYIVRDEDTDYMYYQGNFDNSELVNKEKGRFINPISLQQIKEILEESNIDLSKVILPEEV